MSATPSDYKFGFDYYPNSSPNPGELYGGETGAGCLEHLQIIHFRFDYHYSNQSQAPAGMVIGAGYLGNLQIIKI